MAIRITGQALIFSTGRRFNVQRGVVGISPSLEVLQGHSGVLLPAEPFLDDDDALTDAERIELADFMIAQWQAFRARADAPITDKAS
jgi:hypothetical protein